MENKTCLVGDRDSYREEGMTVKSSREFFSGNGTILYLDYDGGGYTNRYVGLGCIELYTHTNKCI